MLRKLIMLAVTAGVAKKVYDKYEESHNPLAAADAELAATEAANPRKRQARKSAAKGKSGGSKPSAS
jgi:hypothetical protein